MKLRQWSLLLAAISCSVAHAQLKDKLADFAGRLTSLSTKLGGKPMPEIETAGEIPPPITEELPPIGELTPPPPPAPAFSDFYSKSIWPIMQVWINKENNIDKIYASVKAKITIKALKSPDLRMLDEAFSEYCNAGLVNSFASLYRPGEMSKSDRDDLINGINMLVDSTVGLADQITKIMCEPLTGGIKNTCESIRGDAEFYSTLFGDIKVPVSELIDNAKYDSIDRAYEKTANQYARLFVLSKGGVPVWKDFADELAHFFGEDGIRKFKNAPQKVQEMYEKLQKSADTLMSSLGEWELSVMFASNTYMFLRGPKGTATLRKISPMLDSIDANIGTILNTLDSYLTKSVSLGGASGAGEMGYKVTINDKETGLDAAYEKMINDIKKTFIHVTKHMDIGMKTYDPMKGPEMPVTMEAVE